MSKQSLGFEEGLYFDISDEDYHNDPALGSSGVKNLLVSPMKYWRNSSLNPKKKFKRTASMKLGTVLHCYLMERERFYKDYIVLPDLLIDSEFYKSESIKPDFEENFQLPKTKTAKTFKYVGDKIKLSQEEFEGIKEKIDYFLSLPAAGQLFKNGYPEVSIFWRDKETGVMCKCRFDWLAARYISDYKSINNINKIKSQIVDYDYYIQQAFYLRGLNFFRNNPICADNVDEDFINKVINSTHNNFIFAFQDKDDLMVRLKTFGEDVIESSNDLINRALNIYKDSIEKYGLERWEDSYKLIENEPDIEMLCWEDLPNFAQYKYNRL